MTKDGSSCICMKCEKASLWCDTRESSTAFSYLDEWYDGAFNVPFEWSWTFSNTWMAKQSQIQVRIWILDTYELPSCAIGRAVLIWNMAETLLYRQWIQHINIYIHLILQCGSKLFSVNVRDFGFISRCREITRRITNCSKWSNCLCYKPVFYNWDNALK